jgi:hypothetical protein
MERGLVLVQMLPTGVVLALAMQIPVLAMFPLLAVLRVLVLAIQLPLLVARV